jgi:hypothetical protein
VSHYFIVTKSVIRLRYVSIITKCLFAKFHHTVMINVVMLNDIISVVTLNVVMLCVIMLSVIMLTVVILSYDVLIVIMVSIRLIVIMPSVGRHETQHNNARYC